MKGEAGRENVQGFGDVRRASSAVESVLLETQPFHWNGERQCQKVSGGLGKVAP